MFNRNTLFGKQSLLLTLSALIFAADLLVGFVFGPKIGSQYSLSVTPPSYFFKIWFVIYALFAALLFFWAFEGGTTDLAFICFNATSLLNMIWVFLEGNAFHARLYFEPFVLLLMVVALYQLTVCIVRQSPRRDAAHYFKANAASFYLGWCSIAFALNLCQLLVYKLRFSDILMRVALLVAVIAIVVLLSLLALTQQRWRGEFVGFYLSASWGVIGVLVRICG